MGLIDQEGHPGRDRHRPLQKLQSPAEGQYRVGISFIQDIAGTIPVDDTIRIKTRSIMGTEILPVQHEPSASDTGLCVLKHQSGVGRGPDAL